MKTEFDIREVAQLVGAQPPSDAAIDRYLALQELVRIAKAQPHRIGECIFNASYVGAGTLPAPALRRLAHPGHPRLAIVGTD